jgi:hypothetical protein
MIEPESTTMLELVEEHDTESLRTKDGRTAMRCGFCDKAMSPQPGDLIYGGQWYHFTCWKTEERLDENLDDPVKDAPSRAKDGEDEFEKEHAPLYLNL